MLTKKLSLITLLVILFTSCAFADLLPLQGTVYNASGQLFDGDIRVYIYDNATDGTLIYDSGNDFDEEIVNGHYDILLGSTGNYLGLIYGKEYYMDIEIDAEDIDFNGNERQLFQSNIGEIKDVSTSNLNDGSGDIGNKNFRIGDLTLIQANNSFVGGKSSTVHGENSFGFGWLAITNANTAIALGTYFESGTPLFTRAYGDGSFAIQGGYATGINSFSRGKYLEVAGNDSFGINLNNISQTVNDNNVFVVVGGKSGFGTVSPQATLDVNGTLIVGENNQASGLNSVAIGRDNIASGDYSFVDGKDSIASGNYSFAIGYLANASGDSAISLGSGWAAGKQSIGIFASTQGNNSVSIGSYDFGNSITTSYTSGIGSFAIQGASTYGHNSFGRGLLGISGNNSFGINLINETIIVNDNNVFVVYGGNSGFNTTSPQRTVHISDTLRIEPRTSAPTSPSLGDLYVDSDTFELCFYNSTAWVGIASGGACS